MVNLADIAGGNATVQLSAAQARAIYFRVTGSGTVRVGGSTVTSSLGLPVLAAEPLDLEYAGHDFSYNLGGFYAYVPTGTTLSVAYEPFN